MVIFVAEDDVSVILSPHIKIPADRRCCTCVASVCSQEDPCPLHRMDYQEEPFSGWTQACLAWWDRLDGNVWGKKRSLAVNNAETVSGWRCQLPVNRWFLPAWILNLCERFTDPPTCKQQRVKACSHKAPRTPFRDENKIITPAALKLQVAFTFAFLKALLCCGNCFGLTRMIK